MQGFGWDEAVQHPQTPTHVTLNDVRQMADEVWDELSTECNMRKDVNIYVAMDVTQPGVLAYTARTLILNSSTWKPSVMFDYSGTDIEVHVNPNVPNGWYMNDGCNTGWRYDLRTVMRHELLHGAGLSSSIREKDNAYTVGYSTTWGDECYPTFYDTQLESNGVPAVHGCSYHPTGMEVYLAGRRIYAPDAYRSGSSFSHHTEEGLLQWQLRPTTCLTLGHAEYDMLEGMGYNCSNGLYYLSSAQNTKPRWALLLMTAGMSVSLANGTLSRKALFIMAIASLALVTLSVLTHF